MLENPPSGSIQSGISVVSGWKCAAGILTARFDGGPDIEIPYGSDRYDTMGSCDDANNGFVLLINYNDLGDGSHIVSVYDDGELFYASEFSVVTPGTPFLAGVNATCEVSNFPGLAETTLLRWNEATQSFVIESISDFAPPPPPPTSDTFTGVWAVRVCYLDFPDLCNDTYGDPWLWRIVQSGSSIVIEELWGEDKGSIACREISATRFRDVTVSGSTLSGNRIWDTTDNFCGLYYSTDVVVTLNGDTFSGTGLRWWNPDCDSSSFSYHIVTGTRSSQCGG